MQNVHKHWYRTSLTWLTFLLLPLSWIFHFIIYTRRNLYHFKLKKTHYLSAPVIIVGNITAGGTGKTPFVIWLAQELQKAGYRPGIISRGAGGKQKSAPRWVDAASLPEDVGDEAILLKQRLNCPVVVGVDRVAAGKALLAGSDCNIVISDDGLQHYRLGRNIEIAIIDGERGFGNKQLLPAGPLREPIGRLEKVDFVVMNQQSPGDKNGNTLDHALGFGIMTLEPTKVVLLSNPQITQPLSYFKGQKIHALAAIGNPQRFFALLGQAGIEVIEHPYPDHYMYDVSDLTFGDDLIIIMTEKDAVKCTFVAKNNIWFVFVQARLNTEFHHALMQATLRFSNQGPHHES